MLPDEPGDPTGHEAHSDVSGGLASRVLLDRVHRTATKEYRPPLVVKVLYWLAFQAPFPYARNEPSLQAAKARRTIASLMTKFWFGSDHVATTLDIRCNEKGCIFVTQLIQGQVPKDKKRARAFLRELAPRFQEVGLPTWQILPLNPKATGNLIETPDGGYKIIDLESGVVNPMMPIGQWIDAIKAGLIPVFDDVFVAKTRRYIENHRDEIEAALGPEGLRELQRATDEYQDCAEEWQKSELRIWGKLLRAVLKVGSTVLKPLRLLWPPALIGALRTAFRQARDGRRLARNWARGAVGRLVEEGRLDEDEAEKAMRSLEAPETLAVLGHLGAHIAISVPLRFPFGSATRFGWVVFFRLRSEARALIRREPDEQLRGARKIHTLTVAVGSALPGAGTFAYLVAEPLRKNRPLLAVLLDEALRKLPFGLYRRQHLAVLTCWLACSGPGIAPRMVKDRWHSLRPHHLVAWIRDSAERLRPHRTLVAAILAANVVALTVAAIAGGLTGKLSGTFGEFGPMQTLKAAELLLAGVAGYYIYTRFWRLPQAGQRVDAPGSFFWIISGAGLVWLGLDDYFQIHERVGDLLEEGLGTTVPLLNNFDDLILLGYGIIGLAVFAIFLGELMRSRAVFPLLATGIGFLVISQAIDFFAPEGTVLAGVENPTNIIGAGFILTAYLVKLREVWSELPAVRGPIVAGGLPSEP
ncbi:MAG: hypothetical protein ACE5KW_01480 [Dehalococcoidia bacterium]